MLGIKVKSPEIEIDHWALGTAFAHWNSEEQARFLAGAAVEIDAMDSVASSMQLNFVQNEFEKDSPSMLSESKGRVILLLQRLLDRLED